MGINKNLHVDHLNVKIYEDRQMMGFFAAREAAGEIIRLQSEKPEVNIIFAAAPSQNEFLDQLVLHNEIKWDRINAFHMDEYVGLGKDAPRGFAAYLENRIFRKVPFKNVYLLDGQSADIDAECTRYARLLQEHTLDIIFMGIGENGHIAFNDPHVADFRDPLNVKVVNLDWVCRQQQVNDGCFSAFNEVPEQAITLTIPVLLSADAIFCIVPGKAKMKAVHNMLYEEISERCPASILRQHPKTILYLDANSASKIMTCT